MQTIPITFAALTLATVALNSTGCMTREEHIYEPAGASAVYRNDQWQPVDRSHYRHVESRGYGYYDSRGFWHPYGTRP